MPNDRDDCEVDLVVVGNPESRRVHSFVEAARRFPGLKTSVVAYRDLSVSGLACYRPSTRAMVRIESPGECAETTRLILKSGIEPMESRRLVPVDSPSIDAATMDRGQIVHPLQWFLGFERLLLNLEREWGPAGVRWMSTPRVIATAFDKLACREKWQESGLPVPRGYPGLSTYDGLRKAKPARHARVFVKLRYGYSAMGAVALEWRGPLVRAITTVEVAWSQGRPRMFVSKKPRILNREFEIAWLIDTLGMEGIVVEDWLPKARSRGRPFDLRIVTIGGRAHHVVGRAHSSPFTNLNLDASRISRSEVAQHLGAAWPAVLSLAEQASADLSEAMMLGVDVLVRPCRRRFAVLEANAFGDYLPGLEFQGATTYEAELQSLVRSLREAA
jgi:hypothetical protein